MRTIAGQINGFDFGSISGGVNDPASGADVREIFRRAWSEQIADATRLWGPPTVSAINIGGNEHLGATVGAAPLPDLEVDLPLPPGARLGFAYSIDAIIQRVAGAWFSRTVQNSRVDLDGNPDANGPLELQDLSIAASGNTWITTMKAVLHTPDGLPNVGVTIEQREFLFAVGTSVPDSLSLSYSSQPVSVQADTSGLEAAITAIEVLGGFALVGLAAMFGVPVSAIAAGVINRLLVSKIRSIASLTVQLQTIDVVYKSIPQRLRLPGSIDNLWLHYDTLSFPQGVLAKLVDGSLTPAMPGAALVASGRLAPLRARRAGIVILTGPETLHAPPPIIGHPRPALVRGNYAAFGNDEVVNPKFAWSVTDPAGNPLPEASLSSTTGSTVTVTFDASNLGAAGVLNAVVQVSMSDDLGLTDEFGRSPTTGLGVSIEASRRIPPPRPPVPRPPRPEPADEL